MNWLGFDELNSGPWSFEPGLDFLCPAESMATLPEIEDLEPLTPTPKKRARTLTATAAKKELHKQNEAKRRQKINAKLLELKTLIGFEDKTDQSSLLHASAQTIRSIVQQNEVLELEINALTRQLQCMKSTRSNTVIFANEVESSCPTQDVLAGSLPLVMTDTRGALLSCNRAACALFRGTDASAVGTIYSLCASDKDIASVYEAVHAASSENTRCACASAVLLNHVRVEIRVGGTSDDRLLWSFFPKDEAQD